MTNFNIQPYFDDFDPTKNFYKILFRPGYSVQTRELTQMQSILQDQIKSVGDHLFENGTMIIPGELSIDTEFHYVKLQSNYGAVAVDSFIANLVNTTIVGSSGIKAIVIAATVSTSTDQPTLFLKYVGNGSSNVIQTFADSEVITSPGNSAWTTQSQSSGSAGIGSAAVIKQGVYYVNGNFVLCEPQTIILDKYTNTPTYFVGFNVVESFVTPEQDGTLLDNAQGSYNYAAPGAHRFAVSLNLAAVTSLTQVSGTFIQLVSLILGQPQNVFNQTVYADISKVMARRTYDESGDFIVSDFKVDIRENRNNNRGQWLVSTPYIQGDIVSNGGNFYTASGSGTSATAPTTTTVLTPSSDGSISWGYTSNPVYNRGVYLTGDESQLALAYEPGKAYVQGFEIEKVATSYVSIPKARSVSDPISTSLDCVVGNYILITNVHQLPQVNKFPSVDLYDTITPAGSPGTLGVGTTKVGTARIRYFEYHSGTVGTSTAVYKCGLFNVNLIGNNSFAENVHQLFINTGIMATTFSADFYPTPVIQLGQVTSTTTAVLGYGTLFNTAPYKFSPGDYIIIAGTLAKITVVTDDTHLTIDTSISTGGLQVSYSYCTFGIQEPQNSPLIFKLPSYAIKALRDGSVSPTNLTSYYAYRWIDGGTTTSGVATYNLNSLPNQEMFASGVDNGITHNFIGVRNDTGALIDVTVANVTSKQVNVTYPGLVSVAVSLVALIQQTGSTSAEKQKTLTYAQVVNSTNNKTVNLGHADGFGLVSVKMDTGTFLAPTGIYSIDITSRYIFNNGQTDSTYELSSITLNEGMSVPIAPIQITFSYFSHSAGDYFSVNSYSIDYKNIPSYNGISLRDCLDFRPRIDDTGVTYVDNGSGNNASATVVPKRSIAVDTTYRYYLPRVDKVILTPDGNFIDIQGTSSENPQPSNVQIDGMLVSNITLEPYTFNANSTSVVIDEIDNRRYTMRDIGSLDSRISRLETYTALSLLEAQTNALIVPDSNGNNSLKNGFIVDAFSGHNVGNSSAPDYICSIDATNQELRPSFATHYLGMSEVNTVRSNYAVNGDIVTLPFTEVKITSQPFATTTEKINPFSKYNFEGKIELYPEQDAWFDVGTEPDLASIAQKDYKRVYPGASVYVNHFGSMWNVWETDWFGLHPVLATSSNTANWTIGNSGIVPATQFGSIQSQFSSLLSTSKGIPNNTGVTISSNITPYANIKNIMFVAEGLKLNTKVYGLFENSDVTSNISLSKFMTLNYNTTFPTYSNTWDVNNVDAETGSSPARIINNNSDQCLYAGDILTGLTSGATAIVIYQETQSNTLLHVVNVKGSFTTGEVIQGSITGSRGIFVSLTSQADFRTNSEGVVTGIFAMPPATTIQYRTGLRSFTVVDSLTTTVNTSATALYSPLGVTDSNTLTILSTRSPQLIYSNVGANGIIINSINSTGSDNSIIQTYFVSQPTGMFVTSVGIYFSSICTSSNIPVRFEIREMQNGVPTSKIIPFSCQYMYPQEITVSAINTNAPTEKRITFDSPIYLNANTEYAFVLQSDSNEYQLHTASMGFTDGYSGQFVSKQNELRTMFKPQNTSSWVSTNTEYLRINVYRARFSLSGGVIALQNLATKNVNLNADPMFMTIGSGIIRISHPNHGFANGSGKISKVTLSGLSGTINGIASSAINGSHNIANVELDSYTISVGTNATVSGAFGGTVIWATSNIAYDVLYPVVEHLEFNETTFTAALQMTSGKSVNGVETPYLKDLIWNPISINQNNSFSTTKLIGSTENEATWMTGSKSVSMTISLNTTSEYVSPVIDLQRTGLLCISNRINNPSEAINNVAAIDDRIILAANVNKLSFVSASGSTLSYMSLVNSGHTVEMAALSTIYSGRYIGISGATTTANNGNFLVNNIVVGVTTTQVFFDASTPVITEAADSTLTIISHDRFIDETSPMFGSVTNKYLSKEITLANASTGIMIAFSGNIPSEAGIDVYYKVNQIGGTALLNTMNWTKVTYTPSNSNSSTTFIDQTCPVLGLPSFDSFQVKLVSRSTNTAKVPRIKNLRIIASA